MDLTGIDLTTEVLRTERLVLRPWQPGDVDAVHRACRDPESQRWLTAAPSPYTREDAVRFVMDTSPQGRAAGTDLTCAIEADGEFSDVANLASQAVARRAGFREEDVVRACLPGRDGSRSDAVLFGRVR